MDRVGKIQPVEITDEMQKSYLDYAMSVIVSRALPDVRDGLKPVHRRILFSMHQMNLRPGGPFAKSVKVVGEVMGKYHPHGDLPVYDALVRLAQNFSMRYPLVDGQGNFGSVDGDPPAAMRYTEARLKKIAVELINDIDKETVAMIDNFDATLKEPTVLPAKLPNLLLMGADGIAVGMATKIPPHNLREVIQAIVATIKKGQLVSERMPQEQKEKSNGETIAARDIEFTIEQIKLEAAGPRLSPSGNTEVLQTGGLGTEDLAQGESRTSQQQTTSSSIEQLDIKLPKLAFSSEITISELLRVLPGPDFPTGGAIFDANSMGEVYATGRGRIVIRGIAEVETRDRGKSKIVITEIPYQVNKAQLVARIAQLARDKKVSGIADIRDESDRAGMSVVIEIKRDGNPKAILNNLYKHTALQSSFPANFVALVDGVPRTLTLKQIIVEYINHRVSIIILRSIYHLRADRRRAHILEGLKIALDHLDRVIDTIKKASDANDAKAKLILKFGLTEIQAIAILDMQLRRLARLERVKIEEELAQILAQIKDYELILREPHRTLTVIEEEITSLTKEYGDARRTKIHKQKLGEFSQEDLVSKEETLITLTRGGYIKRVPLDLYRQQARGGKGIAGITTKGDDEITHLAFATTHDQLLVFTDKGRVLLVPVWEIPEGSRISKGQAMVNFVNITGDEEVQTILPLPKKGESGYLFMSTRRGVVKKTPVGEFANIRNKGIVAVKLDRDDQLAWVRPTTGDNEILLVTKLGKGIRFSERGVRSMGRATMGVRGIKLAKGDSLVSMEILTKETRIKNKRSFSDILIVTEKGIGKRTPIHLFHLQKRGGLGVKAGVVNPKTGHIVAAWLVTEKTDQAILNSRHGQVIKLTIRNVPQLSRATQGVILMRFSKTGDSVAAVTTVPKEEVEDKGAIKPQVQS